MIGKIKGKEPSACKKKPGHSQGLKVGASELEKLANDLEAAQGLIWDFGLKHWWDENLHPFQ
jgi:hypothetical protein